MIELNEIFAAQALAVLRARGFQQNAWSGAIPFGYPLVASGARLATTAVNRLHATGDHCALYTNVHWHWSWHCNGARDGLIDIAEQVFKNDSFQNRLYKY